MFRELTKKYDLVNVSFLLITPPLAVALIAWHLKVDGWMPSIWILGVFFYFLAGLSITAGYHRLLSHRAYKAHPWIESLLLFFGAGSFENSALKWCTDHRRHHTKCDSEDDPYCIKKGFFYAHMGWIFEAEKEDQTERWGKDLLKNPRVQFQHRHYLVLAVISGFLIPMLLGHLLGSALGGLAVAGVGRVVFVHHATFFINSLCHVWGSQPYGDDNTAKDSRLMAFFTYGEGHHNYHHHFQADYRNGVHWFDFDPTKWLIQVLALLGLATDLVATDEEDILAAKLKMQLKRAQGQIQDASILEEQFNELRQLLRNLKGKRRAFHEARLQGEEMWQQLKNQWLEEKALFQERLGQWNQLLLAPAQNTL